MSGQRVSTRDFPTIVELTPELIILDLLTGSEDAGWVLLQMLKMTPSTQAIPIVLCTGAFDHVAAQRWLLDPIGVWVVYKPFTREALLASITAALNNASPSVDGTNGITSPNGSTDQDPPRD